MKQLSGTDAIMLAAETPTWHFHVAGVTIIAPVGDPHAVLEHAATEMRLRLPLVPKLTWKVREVPLGLGMPVWVHDDEFDINHHIRWVDLPAPGGPRELAVLAGRILSRRLDRRYPLWELWLIEGVCNNRAALVMKYHHCLMDGVSGANMAAVLFDLEPHPKGRPQPTGEEPEAGSTPSPASLLISAIPQAAQAPLRLARYGFEAARRAAALVSFARGHPTGRLIGAPKTSFNGRVGPQRSFGFSSVSLNDVRTLKARFDVKVNDVVLALCAGALRAYLLDNHERTDRPLVAAVPISTRRGDATADNQVASMNVGLATDVADPLDRLHRIHEAAMEAKELDHAIRAHSIQPMGATAPPFVFHMLIRGIYESELLGHVPAMANVVVSNVPGPPAELYCGGARVTGIYATSLLTENMGMPITMFSYGDRMDFGVHVDPELVPDPFHIANGIPAALRELMLAAGLGEPTPIEDPFGVVHGRVDTDS